MANFNFPRDAGSALNSITRAAIAEAVTRLLQGLEEGFWHDDTQLRCMMRGEQDWQVNDILKVGAACAFLKKLDPKTDYDAALVHQALGEWLANQRRIDMEKMAPTFHPDPEIYSRRPD